MTGPICYTLAILEDAPLSDFQRVDIMSLGFRYTVLQQKSSHATAPEHYSRQTEPIVFPQSMIRPAKATVAAGTGSNQ